MRSVDTDQSSQVSSAASEEHPPHYCRGCGQVLPHGFRGHFHKDCLQKDKRSRIRERRSQEEERFKRWLQQQRPVSDAERGMAK